MSTTRKDRPVVERKGSTRRTWIKSAAGLAGGVAASNWLSIDALAAPGQASPASASGIVVASATKTIVETTAGKVRGFTHNGINAFKGIPYARSTAGTLRFMPPAKPAAWSGVRSSLALGPSSPQPFNCTQQGRRGGWNNDEEAFMFDWDDGRPSEDCLRINVWTPGINDNRRRPGPRPGSRRRIFGRVEQRAADVRRRESQPSRGRRRRQLEPSSRRSRLFESGRVTVRSGRARRTLGCSISSPRWSGCATTSATLVATLAAF